MTDNEFRMNRDERIGDEDSPRRPRRVKRYVVLIVLLAFVGIVFYAFSQGQQNGISGVTPVIKADAEPFKVRPDQPGGMEIPHQDKLVYEQIQGNESASATEKLVPGPEKPIDPATKVSASESDAGDADLEIIAIDRAGNAQSKPESLALAPAKEVNVAEVPKPETKKQEAQKQPEMKSEPVTVQEAKKPEPKAEPVKQAKKEPVKTETLKTEAVKTETAKTETVKTEPVKKAETTKTAVKTESKKTASTVKTEKPAASSTPTSTATGAHKIQLASLPDKTQAEKAAALFKSKYPDVLSNRRLNIRSADIPGKGTYYRVQAEGFADKASASAACTSLKSHGQGCLYVAP
ncbi:MAG: hypothetical protein EYC62_01585 [Alphaproteobacteria bacterium]|nr:MAG: hypothetical protein EYC62_01585 [Alphaproteobacteria bacterium]